MDPIPLDRRLYARFPVNLPAKVAAKPFPHEIGAEILDIGMGGARMRVRLPLDSAVRLSFDLSGVRCVFDADVVHQSDDSDPDRLTYGVEFRSNPEMEATLRRLLPPKR